MAEVKVGLRYNNDHDEVELTVDGEVALTSGKDVFESWVHAYNEKHKTVEEPVEPKVVDATNVETVSPVEPVEEAKVEVDGAVDNENQD